MISRIANKVFKSIWRMRCAYPPYDSSTIIFLVFAANLKIVQCKLEPPNLKRSGWVALLPYLPRHKTKLSIRTAFPPVGFHLSEHFRVVDNLSGRRFNTL